MSMDVYAGALSAEARIRPYVLETALSRSAHFSRVSSVELYLKLESLQHTGSFKVRGAMNRILALRESERAAGVIAASTGNHGIAVAYCMNVLGGRAVVYVTESASPGKVEEIRRWGAEVRSYGDDAAITEAHARETARAEGLTYVSPYNDPLVIAGQGTIGVELHGQLRRIDAVFVPLGGGGLISGVAGYLRRAAPEVEIVGCSPANSQVMIQSVRAGRILDAPSLPTISDATAGGVEPGAITFDLCRDLVDRYVTVTEEEIEGALAEFRRVHDAPIEGAAAVALASFLKECGRLSGLNVILVISGGNA
jgi:threonine dehydratase